ncbi:AsnC family transcriptional regulator [Nitrosopumilus sp. b3]|uniref:AsnC family transcriptional regulator n=1 Tax=Nitrosopumilus sp. b3 TaxID=2109909 RepID=UPI0015F5E61F|nr:AsnC family transcriptional regulator [Nitrosopumilus sp. b3]KAF6246172.1 AsnC family transcriptional regulator [Nitrosopumilus sp. b3]
MPHELDEIDVGIVASLQQDGRKSFRQIARELQISTPTVQARYQRLVNIGLIKSISPVIDSTNLATEEKEKLEICDCHGSHDMSLKSGMSVQIKCDLCDGPIGEKPHILKFANFERFFCCNTCKTQYKEKNKGRIQSITEKFQKESKNKFLKAVASITSLSVIGAGVCINHGIEHIFHSATNLA